MNTPLVKTLDNIDISAAHGEGVISGSMRQESPTGVDLSLLYSEYNAFLHACRMDGNASSGKLVKGDGFEGLYRAVNNVGLERFYWSEMGEAGPFSRCYIDDFFEEKLGSSLCDLPEDDITDSLALAWIDGWEEGLLALWNDFQECALGRREAESRDSADASESE